MNPFKKAAKKSPKKKTKAGPAEITVTDPVQDKAIKEWLKGKSEEASGKAKKKKSEGILMDFATDSHRKSCQTVDKYSSSVKLVDDEGRKVTFSFTNRYSEINTDDEDDLKEIYGDDYDRHFSEQTVATLTKAAMDDESFVSTIMDTIGEENFAKYFDVKVFIKPKSSYHEARILEKDLAKKHQEAVDAGLVKCNKPSVKQG